MVKTKVISGYYNEMEWHKFAVNSNGVEHWLMFYTKNNIDYWNVGLVCELCKLNSN